MIGNHLTGILFCIQHIHISGPYQMFQPGQVTELLKKFEVFMSTEKITDSTPVRFLLFRHLWVFDIIQHQIHPADKFKRPCIRTYIRSRHTVVCPGDTTGIIRIEQHIRYISSLGIVLIGNQCFIIQSPRVHFKIIISRKDRVFRFFINRVFIQEFIIQAGSTSNKKSSQTCW